LLLTLEGELEAEIPTHAGWVGFNNKLDDPVRELSVSYFLDYGLRTLKVRYGIPGISLPLFFEAAVKLRPIVEFVNSSHILEKTLHLLVEVGTHSLRLLEDLILKRSQALQLVIKYIIDNLES
jgi:hypothetical protein